MSRDIGELEITGHQVLAIKGDGRGDLVEHLSG